MLRFARAIFILVLSVAVGSTSSMVAYADTRATYIVMPNEGSSSQVRSLIASLGEYPEAQLGEVDEMFIVDLLPEAAAAIALSPAVAFIEQDTPITTAGTQNPTPSWGLDRVDGSVDSSFNFPDQSGEGVIAYIFDTGVAANHPDLVGRVAQGFDVIGTNQANTDCHYHGTHVAGTVAGSQFGVAKKASIVPLRVLSCTGSGSTTGVIRAINWTIANHPAGTPAVANFSLGGGRSGAFNAAITKLVESGITTVVAAGNERTDACTRSPASTLEAITVGATDQFDNRSSFSNFGDCVDMFAPGSSITSADARNFTRPVALSGTSMAAPHVAGIAALVLGLSPNALPEQVEAALVQLSQPGVVKNSSTLRGNRMAIVPGANWTPIPNLSGAPTGLISTGTGKGFTDFAWDAVSGATGYQVEFRKGSQNAFTLAESSTNTFRVEGLSGGEFAYVRVRAIASGITSKFSSTVGARSLVEAPSAPQYLTLDATSKFGMVLSWTTPSYLGGASSLTYRVEMKTTGDWQRINSGPGTSMSISDMKTPHQFRVFAVNEAGTSVSSAEVTFDPALVFAVQTMSAVIDGGSNLNVSWASDAPPSTKFQVTLRKSVGSPDPLVFTVEGSQHRFTGLVRMTPYRVSVVPVGTIRGLESRVDFATAAVVPGPPRLSSNARQVAGWLLNFQAPSDNGGIPISSYRLEQFVAGNWATAQTSSFTTFTVPIPARGTFQDFRLIATNAIGDSIPSSMIRISTPAAIASSPQSFSAELQSDGRVRLSWAAPADDGGAAISSYRVDMLRNGSWSLALTQRNTTSSALILPKGTTISYRVSAVNSAGVSAPAVSAELFRQATAPSAVPSFMVSLLNGVVRLSWGAPSDAGGSALSGYRVERKSGADWTVLVESQNTTSYSMPAGLPGEAMFFRILAINAVGTSIPSSERGLNVPFLKASAPQNFTASAEAGRIRISWEAPAALGGSTLSRYVLSVSSDGGPFRTVTTYRSSEVTGIYSGGAPGKTSVLRLHAETLGAGASLPTEAISVALPATIPADPQSINGQMRPGIGLQLNWIVPPTDGGSPILEYRVELSTAQGWVVLTRTSSTSFLAPLGAPGSTMLHRVVAVNQVGSSPGTRNFLSKMGTVPATAPNSFSASLSGNAVVFSWAAPEIMGGTFSFYEVQRFDGGVFKRLSSTRSLSFTTAAPGPGQSAIYRVAAITNAGTGAFSTVEVSTPKIVPSAPWWSSRRSSGLVDTFSWRTSSNGGGTLDKAVLYREQAGAWVFVAQASATAGTLTVPNELFGQTHRYVLRLTNEVGESANSSVMSLRHAIVATAPATNLTATAQGSRLLLSWTNPVFTGGSAPSFIEVQSSADGVQWGRMLTARISTSALVNIPAKGKSLNYRVVVRNGAGSSGPSNAVEFANPLTAPVGVIGVTTRKVAADKVSFTVTAPTDFGGHKELSLRIERQGTLAWLSSEEYKLTTPRGRLVVTLSIPVTRGTYTYRVVVSNASGELERMVNFVN